MKKLLTLFCLVTLCVISHGPLLFAQNDCATPTGETSSDITASSAKVSWDVVPGAEGYKVRYRVTGTTQWTDTKITIGKSRQLNNLSAETSYTWEVKTYCTVNPGSSSAWSSKQKFTTGTVRLGDQSIQQVSFQVYPNPAADHATVQFTLQQSSHVYINVFDVSGKEMGTLLNGDMEQGDHLVPINTNQFSKGVYLVKMVTNKGIENQKLIVQ